MSSGEDGGRNRGQVLQRGAPEEPLEQVWIWTAVDDNVVAVFDKKYASGRKIPSNIVGKRVVKDLLQIGGSGRGEDVEDQGSAGRRTDGRGNSLSPNLKYRLIRIHVGSRQLAGSQTQHHINDDGKNDGAEDAHQGTLGMNPNWCNGPQGNCDDRNDN